MRVMTRDKASELVNDLIQAYWDYGIESPSRESCRKEYERIKGLVISHLITPPVPVGTAMTIDREQLAAILCTARYPQGIWLSASLNETAIAYKQADAVLALVGTPGSGNG